MALMLIVALLGVLAGRLAGGRWSNLGRWRPSGWAFILAATAAQGLLSRLPAPARGAGAGLGCVLVAAWCLRNRQAVAARGTALLGAGAALNAVVVAANGGMPVSRPALVAAGFPPTTDVARGHLYKHVAMTGGTHLTFLGDVIPLRPAVMVLSPGDILMLLGIALVTAAVTRHGSPAPDRPSPVRAPAAT